MAESVDRWEDDLAAEILRYILENLSVAERAGLFVRFYVAELMPEIGYAAADRTLEVARVEVARRLPWRLVRDVFQPSKPTASEFVRGRAELIAERSIAGWKREFYRFGSMIAVDEAPSYAYLGLVELGKRMLTADPHQPEVRNPEAVLARIVRRLIQKDLNGLIRHAEPRTQILYERTRDLEKELRQDDPDVDEQQCAERAAEEAAESIDRTVRFLYRVEYEEGSGASVREHGYDHVLEDDLVETLERIVFRGRFTLIDRDTWALWRAVDFRGRDVDWLGLRGLTVNTGPQRLVALCRKLRDFLGPDFF
jgi:hypothetical protein